MSDTPSDEVIEAVAEAAYGKMTEMAAKLRPGPSFKVWDELPTEQKDIQRAAMRVAIEAYQNITGGLYGAREQSSDVASDAETRRP